MRLLNIYNLFCHSILGTYILIIQNILQCKDERLHESEKESERETEMTMKTKKGRNYKEQQKSRSPCKSLGLTRTCSGIKQFPLLSTHSGEYYEIQI